MNPRSVFVRRFSELEDRLKLVEGSKRYQNSDYMSGDRVDSELLLSWSLKAKHLIATVCKEDSEYYKKFCECEAGGMYTTNYEVMLRLKAVFIATKEDFESGYLNTFRNLVQAEVFGTELDQARELFKGGYIVAAAVIAGVVLETALRQLCEDNAVIPGNLNKMNADLTKAGVYNNLIQKRITALADIRNSAAHGHPENFNRNDVEDMIKHVESFLIDRL